MDKKLNECILVAGKKDNKFFLAKNRDRKFIADFKVYHTLYKDIEVAYYEDSTGWIEGLNEYGISFIFTYLMDADTSYYKWRAKWGLQAGTSISGHKGTKHTDGGDKKREELKDILTKKTLDKAVEYVKTLNWNGSYFIGSPDGIWEIEHFNGVTESKKCDFDNTNFKVKTNYGDIIKNAGHQDGYESVLRGNAEVRKTETERYLIGFKNYTDVIKRMQQQSFTNDSSLNVFRTDDEEVTICQVLMDLNNKIFQFIYYDENSNFFGLKDELPKNYDKKINVFVRNKKEFDKRGEYKEFMQKAKDLYYHYKTFKVDF